MHAFKTILVAITHAHTSELELNQAFTLAKDNNARLIFAFFDPSLELIHKLQFLPLEEKIEAAFKKQLEEEAENFKQKAWEAGISAECGIIGGKPRQLIMGIADEVKADLVIKLADPSGALARNQLTGNDLALLRKCRVPVLMMTCRDQMPGFTGKVMVAVDVGDPDQEAVQLNQTLLQYGQYLSTQEKAELHIVSVWELGFNAHTLRTLTEDEIYELQESTHRRYQENLAKTLKNAGIDSADERVHTHLLKGKAATEIQRLANEINVDFIVMGTLGRHSRGMLMGNTAENILNSVYCSILAVKPEGFVSPLA